MTTVVEGVANTLEGVSTTRLFPTYVNDLSSAQYTRGGELARMGRRTDADRADLQALSEAARIEARVAWRPTFDPSRYLLDQALLDRRNEAIQDLDQTVRAERLLLADVSEARIKSDPAKAAIRRPDVPAALLAGFIAVFAATVAPTLHDTIFYTLNDELLNWFCSLMIAGLVGVSVILAIFCAAALVPEQALGRGAMVAGIAISAGLAVLRGAGARTAEEFALTIGLMAIEIGVILSAEYVAKRHQQALAAANAEETAATQAGETVKALVAELARVQRRKQELIEARDVVEAEIADRSHPAIELGDLETLSVQAACTGYWNAITENVGRMARTGGAS